MTPQKRIAHALSQLQIAERLVRDAAKAIRTVVKAQAAERKAAVRAGAVDGE